MERVGRRKSNRATAPATSVDEAIKNRFFIPTRIASDVPASAGAALGEVRKPCVPCRLREQHAGA
jgi:hypothetical protein